MDQIHLYFNNFYKAVGPIQPTQVSLQVPPQVVLQVPVQLVQVFKQLSKQRFVQSDLPQTSIGNLTLS